MPGLIWLCYAGQRVMRAAAIWEGIVFLDEHPEFARARALQAVMIALETHGAWRCFKHLPSLGDGGSGKGSESGTTPAKRGDGGSGSGKPLKGKAPRVVPAGYESPNGSPRSSVA